MKRIVYIVFAVLSLLFCGKSAFSQTLEWDVMTDGFVERVFLASALQESDDFDLALDASSRVVVYSNDDCNDLEAFLRLKHAEFESYEEMDKIAFGDMADSWRAALPIEIYVALLKQENLRAVAQNNFCNTAEPFCTDNGLYEFPAGVNAGSGEMGPYYDCLRTTPNPAWYYMRILEPGDMDIYMYSTPQVDIDFCCWGPFDDPLEPCPDELTRAKVVSCSYSTNWNETCEIRNATSGEYYILLITNYSNRICNIHFSKTDGEATTDCSILPPLVSYDMPVCVGGDLSFYANGLWGSEYHWFLVGGGWSSDEQNPVRHHVTTDMAGTYGCAINNGGSQSDTTYLEVYISEHVHRYVDTIACDLMEWNGESFVQSGVYSLSYETLSGCDSIIELTLDMNYTPLFEIEGTHWPVGGSETHISVNEYAIEFVEPFTTIDTVLWQIDCDNWYIEPHGNGISCTLYIFTYLLEPVMLHACAVNRCDTVCEDFFIQTSYFDVHEAVVEALFEVFPNPTTREVVLRFEGLTGMVDFELFDAFGQKVDAFQVDADASRQHFYDMYTLPDGVYLLVGRNKGRSWATKVVLMHG